MVLILHVIISYEISQGLKINGLLQTQSVCMVGVSAPVGPSGQLNSIFFSQTLERLVIEIVSLSDQLVAYYSVRELIHVFSKSIWL